MCIKKTIGIMMLASVSNFASANVWMPTNADSNFFSFANFFNPQASDTFGIFEDNVSVESATPIVKFDNTALVAFTEQANNDWEVSTGNASGTLSESSGFQIGWLNNSNQWVSEVAYQEISTNSYLLTLGSGSDSTTLLTVDIKSKPDEGNVSGVPVPGAVWLFGSALLGLIRAKRNTLDR